MAPMSARKVNAAVFVEAGPIVLEGKPSPDIAPRRPACDRQSNPAVTAKLSL